MTPLPIGLTELSTISGKCLGEGRRSILFCGSDVAEGSSTISYALAQRIAGSGRRVLYVDFNSQNSFTGNVLCLPARQWNLADPVNSDAYFSIKGRNLTLLTFPVGSSFNLEECEPEIVRLAVARWSQEFSVVIADAPPVARSNRTGLPTETLAAGFDSTVLVALSGKTPSVQVQKSVARLREAGANIVGLILNDREMPDLRSELGRQVDKIQRRFPQVAQLARNWLETRRVFDVEF